MLSIQTLGIAILLHNQNLSRKVDNSCRHSIPTAVDSTKLRQIQVVISQNPPVFWLQQPGCKSSACVQCLRGASCNNASNFQVNKNYERCWKGKGTGKPALVIKIWNRAIEKTCLKYDGTEKSALALAQLYQTKDWWRCCTSCLHGYVGCLCHWSQWKSFAWFLQPVPSLSQVTLQSIHAVYTDWQEASLHGHTKIEEANYEQIPYTCEICDT